MGRGLVVTMQRVISKTTPMSARSPWLHSAAGHQAMQYDRCNIYTSATAGRWTASAPVCVAVVSRAPPRFYVTRPSPHRRNLYETLGVPAGATDSVIKTAYLALAREVHPDKLHQASADQLSAAHNRFVEINAAFAVLGDSQKRRSYDMRAGLMDMQHRAEKTNGGGWATPAAGTNGFDRDGYFTGSHKESPYQIASNSTIVLCAIAVLLVGAAVHAWRIAERHDRAMEILNQRNTTAATLLNSARNKALENSVSQQLASLRASEGSVQGTGAIREATTHTRH